MAIAEPPGRTRIETREPAIPVTWEEHLPDEITCVLRPPQTIERRTFSNIIESIQSARVEPAWGWVPIACFALFWAAIAVTPVPAEPLQYTLLEDIVGWGEFVTLMAGFGVGAWAAFTGLRWGLWAALPASLVFVFSVVTCPLSGHHNWGLWNVGTFACAFGALALNIGALKLTRSS